MAKKEEIERLKAMYPTTFSKMDTNMRIDVEYMLDIAYKTVLAERARCAEAVKEFMLKMEGEDIIPTGDDIATALQPKP